MKFCLKIVFILALLLLLFGCAGLANKKSNIFSDPLRETIPESFHFNLQDVSIRKHLSEVDPAFLSPDQKLEVHVLRELSVISAENELSEAFDRLWERHKEVRNLLQSPDQRDEFIYPLVELYYFMSAVPKPSWQEETAEKLYEETLIRLNPDQLSGYALHFYTMALIKNDKYDVAMPFLTQLQDFTAPDIYLEDLTFALSHAAAGNAAGPVCQLIQILCEYGIKNQLDLPEEALDEAILSLQKKGKLKLAQETLRPIIRENKYLEKYSFAKKLIYSQNKEFDTSQVSEMVVFDRNRKAAVTESNYGNSYKNPYRLGPKSGEVRIRVQVIEAGRSSNYIDPALSTIHENLQKVLNYSSFKLISAEVLNLKIGQRGMVRLPDRNHLLLTPKSMTSELSTIEVTVLMNDDQVFQTHIESVHGGMTTIGGPQNRNTMLLLQITTFISNTYVH